MVVSCSLCGEQYGVTEDVTFHKFPANEERRKKWLSAVQRGTWLPGKRSMLCSKHFPRDKFVYKISGDKVRRYLMPDTVPTIFDRNNRKAKKGAQQLDTNHEAMSSNLNSLTNIATTATEMIQLGKDTPVTVAATNSTGKLNLEILAATSVVSEPYLIATDSGLTKLEIDGPDVIPELSEIPGTTPIAVPGSSTYGLKEKAQNKQKRLVNFSKSPERACQAIQIQTDCTSLPKRPRQVYPGDFKELNYNNVTEVSKSWTVLNNYIKKMRTNMKVLRQHNRRLEKRVTDLKSVIKILKSRIVSQHSPAVQLCGNSDLSATTEAVSRGDQLGIISNPLIDHDYTFVNDTSTS